MDCTSAIALYPVARLRRGTSIVTVQLSGDLELLV